MVKQLKEQVKNFLYLGIPNPKVHLIVEIDASNIGYRGILKQNMNVEEQLV